MPNDPRSKLHTLPELTAEQVRELGDRAAVETAEERAKSFDRIRQAQAVLKRADEIMARRTSARALADKVAHPLTAGT
jgi:DNA-binding protein H-NS